MNNIESILIFLRDHPVIPSESSITIEEKDLYDELFEYLNTNQADACVSLIVNSYRPDSSAYLSEVFAKILNIQNKELVVTEIINSIKSQSVKNQESALFFAVEIASEEFIAPIVEVLQNDQTSEKIVDMSIDVLESIKTSSLMANIEGDLKFGFGVKGKKNQVDTEKIHDDIERIIETQFRKNKRWAELVKVRDKRNFSSLIIKLNWKAKKALQRQKYDEVISLLGEYDGNLPKTAQQKLDTAKNHLNK